MITGFNHSGFVVGDLEAMVAFYRDQLGLTVVREIDSLAPAEGDHTGIPGAHRALVFVGLPEGTHLLELVKYLTPASPNGHLARNQLGAGHVCFDVDHLAELHTRLSAAGVRFVTEPKFRVAPDGSRHGICYAQDPEGNWLEFIEDSPASPASPGS